MNAATRWTVAIIGLLAANLLAGSTTKSAAIAAGVGYESEASFSRAFKRVMGKSPAEFRLNRQ